MNLPWEFVNQEARYYILPIEYEGNLTGRKGAKNGSKEIINASYQLEYYDEQFDNEPYKKGIHLLQNLTANSPEEITEKISKEVSKYKDKFIISLGGDHSVSIGIVKGLENVYDDFSVIIFDAHPDLFYSWNNSRLNHRCTSFHISSNHSTALVGIRSMDKDELEIVKNNNIHLIYSHENVKEKLSAILSKLKNKVYISIDVDCFDPSFVRNTGTPEPGGFFWKEFIGLLEIIFKNKTVIGADIVEFSPNENFESESYSLAKLIYKIISMKEMREKII